MAKIRTVKPEFWLDRKLAIGLSREERLFYIGLWNHCDDSGRFYANARMLIGVIFPHEEDLDEKWVDRTLQKLSDLDRVILYTAVGERLGEVVTFKNHQRINNPTKSSIPAPNKDLQINMQVLPLDDGKRSVGKGREGKGKDKYVKLLWLVFLDEMCQKKDYKPKLTDDRKRKIGLLYDEQLRDEEDVEGAFRKVMQAVKASDFHMAQRAYQMPESLFVNASRRERWVVESKSNNTMENFADSELIRLTGGSL